MAEVTILTGEAVKEIDRIMAENPKMKAQIKKIISSVLQKARTSTANSAKTVLHNDPRAAYRAVKRTVYKRMLGGAISILAKRRAGSTKVHVEKERKLTAGQRGGNRRPRSARTEQIDSYYGSDRGFILRFVNAGTAQRTTRYGNRGSISGKQWFDPASAKAINEAAEQFCKLMDEEILKQVKTNG